MLMEWSEAAGKLPILNSTATPGTPTTLFTAASFPGSKDVPSALDLPELPAGSMATYPNHSKGASSEVELSKTTAKYSEITEETTQETTPRSSGSLAVSFLLLTVVVN